ncbi:succinate dehydrogenase, cytochrome b556 subunit [Magnetospirillum fulvum]|jgi:succinate dehydrogenase / fumarate reductase cytochrome b subunit|uniref:Succinate dehydrogenase cytochrome b556 subunit n=1 Tax=Magnetospirillum fulvum TaxID=1082 RepID=A0A1H6IHA8_MAGFU|nr:succinate dehydrogenase, cytochrome b556 subunit [Magnetospirillum fulvum]SEH45648.1 succinate dehydrogenase subunit C [Magnetospirillum fulvum]
MTKRDRPLSPHLQIYKMPFTAVLSISHRITGVVMAVGTLVLAYWLISAAYGPDAYATAQAVLGSVPGRLLLFGWSVALFYHLCNGIRHMFWDAGMGFEIRDAVKSGYITVGAALALTILAWAIGV